MTPLKLVFIPTVVLVFGAGLVVGRITTRIPPIVAATQPATKPVDRGPNRLHDQLGLTADQRKQMDAIWDEVMKTRGERFDRERKLEKERDNIAVSLLTPDQKVNYDKAMEDYRTKRTALDKEREAVMAQANERSRALLNDEQKKKWDEWSKEMRNSRGGPRGPRGGDRGGERGGPPTRPNFDAPKP